MEGYPLHRDGVHGATDYQGGCRCPDARRAKNIYSSIYRAGRRRSMPNIGARRRLQALAVMGWSLESLAPHVDLCRAGLQKVRAGTNATIEAATWTTIAKAYAALCDTPGPNRQSPARARRAGWLPPESWIDIDDPRERPRLPLNGPMGVLERMDEYHHLVTNGATVAEARAALGLHHDGTFGDYLVRWRRARREAA